MPANEVVGLRAPKRKQNRVEILTTGARQLVFVDGVQLRHVLDIVLPTERGEVFPQVVVTLHPESVVVKSVGSEEFRMLLDGESLESDGGQGATPDLLQELRSLRQENRQQSAALVQMAALLKRWDSDGLPSGQ